MATSASLATYSAFNVLTWHMKPSLLLPGSGHGAAGTLRALLFTETFMIDLYKLQ